MAARKTSFILKKRPPRAAVQFAKYREEVRKATNDIGEAHVKSREQVVSNWSRNSKPRFSYRTIVTLFRIAIEVMVREVNKDKPIWKWVDETGTKAHPITPKPSNRSRRLFFQWGGPGSYQAKTGANPARYGGPGVVRNGSLTVAARVRHPGFKARKFSDQINDDIEKGAKKTIRDAGRRGLRKGSR